MTDIFKNIPTCVATVSKRIIPFCHVSWVHWQCVWCSPWLAWTFSLFGKPADKQNATCYSLSNESNQTECLIHEEIFSMWVLQVKDKPLYHTESKLHHCLQVCKQIWLHSRFIFSSLLFSFSPPLLLCQTRCALSSRRHRAWNIWRFCLTHRISENQAHHRTLKGHKQEI